MNQAIENKILKGNVLKNNNLKNKTKEGLEKLNQKKIIKLTSIGIAGLSALKVAIPKSILIEKALLGGLNTLLYGNSSVYFLGVLPIPNIVVLVLIICVIGQACSIATGDTGKEGGSKR